MPRKKPDMFWVFPILLAVAFAAIYLIINVLPSGTFGTEWTTIKQDLWAWTPWLITFTIGLVILKLLVGGRRRWR